MGEYEIKISEYFKYLDSIIQNDRSIDKDITYKIQADWTKLRRAQGVLCDCKSSTKTQG